MEPDLLNPLPLDAQPLPDGSRVINGASDPPSPHDTVDIVFPPRDLSLEELYSKISGFPEMLQESNLPMLSKASVLAQIASARALERAACALEEISGALHRNEVLERITLSLEGLAARHGA